MHGVISHINANWNYSNLYTMELNELIRANFYRIMESKGLSVPQIAKEKGVTRQTIYSYFRPGLNLHTLDKMAEILQVHPSELLTPIDNQPEKPRALINCPYCGKLLKITPAE